MTGMATNHCRYPAVNKPAQSRIISMRPAAGMKEEAYRRVTYDLTISMATSLAKLNPTMTFVPRRARTPIVPSAVA